VRAAKAPLPDKLYFKIGEVAEIVGVQPYVLRYWESEFSTLRPAKSRSKHRLYRPKDVETLLQIKHLLHDERFTIEGARKRLKHPGKQEPHVGERSVGERAYRHLLVGIRREIEALHRMLG